ncbi:MAG: polysaccharide pyruvyl transferase family protein [Ruminococcus flavefaciens]|nr:polysaccharide pyruvyl transferase family protein [Ruminococcus flavefaciens]
MKISLITLHTVNNYGSALQTYATQTILEKMGHTVEVVDYWRKDNAGEAAVDKALQSPSMQKIRKFWDWSSISRKIVRIPLKLLLAYKRRPMQVFLKKRVNLTSRSYYSMNELLADVPKADIYMTGSDQVWNSIWNKGIEKPYFLEYAPEGKKRIAFSASIGRTKFSEYEIPETVAMLKKYSAISVREESAVKLLESFGIKSELVLDPTLMLTKKDWLKIAEKPHEKKPYLLIYQLNPNKKMDKFAVEIAKRNNWNIIRICFAYPVLQKNGKCVVSPSVEKLLGYFCDAQCILTDSFHATAFSLNLGKDFVSVLPKRFGTRIESILKLTGTENRILKDYSDYNIVDSIIDKSHVHSVLVHERKKGREFLNRAIGGVYEKHSAIG